MPVPTSTSTSIPTQAESQTEPTAQPTAAEGETTQSQPQSTEQLPDATLDFAAKMFDLARQGDQILLAYLSAGLPSDLTNSKGDTLLMLAAYHGHASLVSALLDPSKLPPAPTPTSTSTSAPTPPRQLKPANPNSLNARGQSPIAGAVFKGYDEVVKILIEGGADPEAGQPSAVDTAKMFGRWEDGRTVNSGNGNGEGEAEGEVKKGFKELFENASGRGRGAEVAPPAVPDREQGPARTAGGGGQ